MPLTEAAAAVLASGITAGANLFSQVHTNAMNLRSEEDARIYNERMQREMNWYNSPFEQVQRLRAAGLNPALAYGADGEVTGNQSGPVVGNPVVYQAPQADYSGVINAAVALREQENRNKVADAEVALKDAYTLTEALKQDKYRVDTETGRENLRQLVAFFNPRLENLMADTAVKYSQEDLNKMEKDFKATRIKVSESELKNLDARTRQIIETLPYTVKQMSAETGYLYMQSKKCAQDIEYAWQYLCNDTNRARSYADSVGLDFKKFDFQKQAWSLDQQRQLLELKAHFFTDNLRTIGNIVTGGLLSAPQTITTRRVEESWSPERMTVRGLNQQNLSLP